jgi:nucleoside-diphosphate-sugar epimerase
MNPVPARVLVTGAAGTIGRAVTSSLASAGIAVTALSLAGPFPPEADRQIRGDATLAGDIDTALADVDAVVHLAAIPHPDHDTPGNVFATNAVSTFRVLSAAGERGIRRAVIASSIQAFGVSLNPHRPYPAYFPLDESLPFDIADGYSHSKRVDELSAQVAWRRWGIDVVALRFPLVTDAEALRAGALHAVEHPEDGACLGWAYLDLRDAARAVHLALTVPLEGAHVIGLSAQDTLLGGPTREHLERYAPGVPVRSELVGTAAAVDTRRAEELLGFRPQFSIHEAPGAHH